MARQGAKPTKTSTTLAPIYLNLPAFGLTASILQLLPGGKNTLKYPGLQISFKTGECLSSEVKSPLPPRILLIALKPDPVLSQVRLSQTRLAPAHGPRGFGRDRLRHTDKRTHDQNRPSELRPGGQQRRPSLRQAVLMDPKNNQH